MLIKSGVTCQCRNCKELITTGDFKYTYRKKVFCFKCGSSEKIKGKIMANKSANTEQKKWMDSITDWSVDSLHLLYGEEYSFHPIQRHHVLGRSAKQNKVHIGHWFILPVPFELHDPNVDHEAHVGKCKKAFVKRFGAQRTLFDVMYQRMKEEGYNVPNIEVYNAIMGTAA